MKTKEDTVHGKNGGSKSTSEVIRKPLRQVMVQDKQEQKRRVTERKESEIRVAAPIFVQATKNGMLASRIREEVQKLGKIVGWRFKVVERSGTMLKDILTRADIFSGEVCGRDDCGACSRSSKRRSCRRRGILYETSCDECMVEGKSMATYVGESARSSYERMNEHLDDAKSRRRIRTS